MKKITLGRTNLEVSKDSFGALPLQRATMIDAVKILRKALDGGINFFDTARGYLDSEEKIGSAFSSRRQEVIIATKGSAKSAEDLKLDLETSLGKLKTDYIDIYLFHNPSFVPVPGEEHGAYEAALEAKAQGKIRFIGMSNHRLSVATEAVKSGFYDVILYPFSYLSSQEEIDLTKLCAQKDVGFVAMKALGGGLLTDIFTAQAWMSRLANVVPIWGIQRESELDQLFEASKQRVGITPEQLARIESDRSSLGGEFCRGCGYCMPCPVDIPISIAARISFMLQRFPVAKYITPQFQSIMDRIGNCQQCGHCTSNCPYGLDAPALLDKNLKWYRNFIATR